MLQEDMEKKLIEVHVSEVVNSRRIYWRAPAVMGSSFTLGIILMLAHHLLYQGMNGQLANDAILQLWIIRAGTAFAFLSKLLLAMATAVAYTQRMWQDLNNRSHDMGSLDAMFAVLGDAFEFFKIRVWLMRPTLGLLAVITWLLPISAIITPGTLSVQLVVQTAFRELQVAQRGYDTASTEYCGTTVNDNTTTYASMATGLLIPTMSTLLSNSILPVESSSANLTYSLAFYGPAVSCAKSSEQDLAWATGALLEYENTTGSTVYYWGWVPQAGWGPDVNGTFFQSTNLQNGNIRLDFVSEDAARVYIYLNTTGIDINGNRVPNSTPSQPEMITCALYNASYTTYFDISSTGQQLITAEQQYMNWMPAKNSVSGTPTDPLVNRIMNTQAVMEAFGMMMMGPVTFSEDVSFPVVDNNYALSMNAAMWPSRPGLNQSEVAQYMIDQSEELFQNITLSMRYAVVAGKVGNDNAITNATQHTFESQFVYEPRTLLVAYGISTLVALLCVAMGVYALRQNGVSYTNSFSTIVRVTRDPELDKLIEDEGDLQGTDPVPPHIHNAVVKLGRRAKYSAPGFVFSGSL